MKLNTLPAMVLLTALSTHAFAGPLKEAKINQIVNDVKVIEPRQGARPAALQDSIKDDLAVTTGVQSRAELLFQDNTLTRLGAETFFSFQPGTRNLNLDRGSMLLQVPKNLGGARIRAASVTASITGTTIMMEYLPGRAVKLVVLEGSLRVETDRRPGESIMLHAGKMVIVTPDAKEMPKPTDVDLRKLVRTSVLIDPTLFKGKSRDTVAALPSLGLIEKEIALQNGGAKGKDITGNAAGSITGPAAVPDSSQKLAANDNATLPNASSAGTTVTERDQEAAVAALKEGAIPATGSGASADGAAIANLLDGFSASSAPAGGSIGSDAAATVTGGNGGTPQTEVQPNVSTNLNTGTISGTSGTTTPPPVTTTPPPATTTPPPATSLTPITITFDANLPTISLTGANVVNTSSLTPGMPLKRTGSNAGLLSSSGPGGKLDLRGPSITISPSAIYGVDVSGGNGGGGLLLLGGSEGGSGGTVAAGTSTAPIAGDITVAAPIMATTGKNTGSTITSGAGGAVQLVSNGSVTVSSSIKVSDSASYYRSRSGGSIGIKTTTGAINVTSSGQLLSLLAASAPGPGGTIKFVTQGGDILVDGGRVQADRGTVEMLNTGDSGKVELRNATVSADVVKIGAVGANGQLIIGGGTISADTTLKLYAGTTNGEVRFTDNVTLGGASTKTIAGRIVTIDNGKTVTVGGSRAANVFTDNANYSGSGGNASTTGKFGGAGATTKPFAQTPAF